MKITINAFSLSSVKDAVLHLRKYAAKLKRLEEELPKALAEYGRDDAQVRFDNAAYDIVALVPGLYQPFAGYHPSIKVTAEPSERGWKVIAEGQEVCFVEFGAGICYNGDDSYLGERPPGIVGIGEYGEGRGKQPQWLYGNPAEWTHGTPASNALYFTAMDIEDIIEETARKILND